MRDTLYKLASWNGALILAVLLFAFACGGNEEAPAEAPEPEAAPVEMMALDAAVLADETRPAEEVAQDAARQPIQVYSFFGVQPGMTVADVWPGAGYNMHLLSRLVGDGGAVHAVMGFYADGDYATLEAVRERVTAANLSNVSISNALTDVPADSVDVAIAVRNYHDAQNSGDGGPETVAQLFTIVKPGGVVGIVEVATDREGWDEETHRLNEQTVIDEFTAGGFVLEASTDMLRNPEDDHSTSGWEQGRHTMDRYVLKFRKPMN
jgi:predicted methyltransferase